MFKHSMIIVFLVFLVHPEIQSQELKFGKVTKIELEEKTYPKDSSANAAYLYRYRNSYYEYNSHVGLELITEIQERIKIYNKDGFKYATKIINLYKSGNTDVEISGLKGYSYALIDGEIVETKLDKSSIFKSEYSKNVNQVKLTMPNLKEGSVVEYKYRLKSPFIQSISEFRFQEEIPIRKVEASMRIFDYFKFNQRHKGFLNIKPVTTSVLNNTLNVNAVRTEFNLNDIPALKEEPFVTNIDNYRSAVKFEIESLEIPGSTFKNFSKSWDDVVKSIYNSSSFGAELKKKKYFEDELDVELATISDQRKRLDIVLNFVRKKVKWNEYMGVGCDEGVKVAYKEKLGNSGDINLMIVAMLKYAGIKAYPVLISTRDNGIPLFPTIQGFNYVIASAKINDKEYLIDGTDPYSTVNILPLRALNWWGRMVSDSGSSTMVELAPKKKSVDLSMLNVTLNDDGSIEGNYKQRYTQYNAMLFRKAYNHSTEDTFLEELEKENDDIEISNYEIKYNEDLLKPIVQSYDIFKEDVVDQVDGKLYFSPLFYKSVSENPFKSEEREFPVEFGYPWEDKLVIKIKIPEGYQVESIPETTMIALPEQMGNFKYNISEQQGSLVVNSEISLNVSLVPAQEYQFLKEFYNLLVQKQSEKVVLSKITKNGIEDSAAGSR
ncbi:transglutaminase [Aurantibacter sp.]|uniref:transglutaminase n=1 Tax=Aurantibacter sp. TaxID=2807103 RepID=UPI0032661D58